MRLLIFGLGFCGTATARAALEAGWTVSVTTRNIATAAPAGVQLVAFRAAGDAIASATHILATAPPRDGTGDPVLTRYAAEIAAAPLMWLGYLSTTGVYGDRGGGWVDEATVPAPTADRGHRRLGAEMAWRAVAAGRPLDIFRLAGIYGPGRSIFEDLATHRARRVIKPGHTFGRIHVDDIAHGVLAAIARPPQGARVLNFCDDEPAESAEVTAYAAGLAGVPVPQAVPFDEAWAGMGEMARSFWAESRRVANAQTKSVLRLAWRYPTYREGLAAILAKQRDDQPG